jgi:hypothetical protein
MPRKSVIVRNIQEEKKKNTVITKVDNNSLTEKDNSNISSVEKRD